MPTSHPNAVPRVEPFQLVLYRSIVITPDMCRLSGETNSPKQDPRTLKGDRSSNTNVFSKVSHTSELDNGSETNEHRGLALDSVRGRDRQRIDHDKRVSIHARYVLQLQQLCYPTRSHVKLDTTNSNVRKITQFAGTALKSALLG